MRKFLALMRVFFKTIIGSSMTIKIGGKESKAAAIALWSFVGIALIPLLLTVVFIMWQLFYQFNTIGQLPVAIGLALHIGAIIIFVFSLMAAPALFYFAKDVEYLLPLPIKPEKIIGAKFAVALAFEYIIALALMAAMFAALFALGHIPVGVLGFNAIITLLTLPILPMVYSTVLVMLLMRVTRFVRNPDRYTMFVGVFALVLAVAFVFASQGIMLDQDLLMEAIMGEPVVLSTLNAVFINNGFAARAIGSDVIFGGALHNQAINLIITAAAVIVFFLLAKVLYFAGVIGLSESGAPSKRMTAEDIAQSTRARGRFFSYLVKELKLLFRSPSAFINCVASALIVPVILAISLVPLIRGSSGELTTFLYDIDFGDPRIVSAALALFCAMGFFMGGMAPVAITAISREGRSFFIMKYLPFSYSSQLNAKAVSGLVILFPALFIMLIPVQILFSVPVLLFIGGVILAIPGMLFVNYLGLYVDLLKPKLNWDNEQAAVKQNLNIVVLMFGSWIAAGGVVVIGFLLLRTPVVAFLGLFGFAGLLAVGAVYLAVVKGAEVMELLH